MLMAALGVAASGAPERPAQPALTEVEWVATPTGLDIARAFPPDAVAGGRGGAVLLDCEVDALGRLAACAVEVEEPVGLSFGLAAMELAPLFRMATLTPSGEPVAGRTIRIPILFQLSTGD